MIAVALASTAGVTTQAPAPLLTEMQFFLLLSFALLIAQTLFRVWDKKDNQAVLSALAKSNEKVIQALQSGTQDTLAALNKSIETFSPHLERNRKILGMVQDLKAMHDIRDDDGRFIWYMPKEIIETQRELTKLTQIVANTQEHIAKVIGKQHDDFERVLGTFKDFMVNHKAQCTEQFGKLKEEIRDQK